MKPSVPIAWLFAVPLKYFLVAYAPIVVIFTSGCAIPPPDPSQISPDLRLIRVQFAISCAVPSRAWSDGPITLTWTLQNISMDDTSYSFINCQTDFGFDLFRNGHEIPRTAEGNANEAIFENDRGLGPWSGSQIANTIKPLKMDSFAVDLKRVFKIRASGTYVVTVKRELWADNHRVLIGASTTFTLAEATVHH